MKIGIYNEASRGSSSIGGSECVAAVLAEALGRFHQVEIVHHRPSLSKEQLMEVSGADLSAIHLRRVAIETSIITTKNPCRRYREAQAWQATVSEPYDLFISIVHSMPPFCHAPQGVLIVLFPFYSASGLHPWQALWRHEEPLWKILGSGYFAWEWKRRLDTYQLKTAISHFVRDWTKRRWGIDCQVAYPPVESDFRVVDKTNSILSVGRFASAGVNKRQLEMVTTFRAMQDAHWSQWQYYCVGGLGELPEDQAYFEHIRDVGAGSRAVVLANVERARIRTLYEQAKIFWHAAGYGEDDSVHPELTEHFGIVTVEAMAAGCVPIVINKGAQPEIIQHGVNGFLWNTLDELKQYTLLVARDEQLRVRLSQAARAHAQFFSRERFVQRFLQLLQPSLSQSREESLA